MERNNLGVSKTSKNIRKSPLHQPNFNPTQTQTTTSLSQSQQHQSSSSSSASPQVYNISKNDFRTLVQQLTSHNPPITTNSSNFPNPKPNYRHSHPPPPAPPNPNYANFPPARPPQLKPPSQRLQKIRPPPLAPIPRAPPPPTNPNPIPTSNFKLNLKPDFNPNLNFSPHLNPRAPAESPVSAYMRYLESSFISSDGGGAGGGGGAGVGPRTPAGLLPSPMVMSPSAFLNLASPRSPYPPLLSPRGFNYPPPPPLSPLTPNFAFSPGIMGPAPGLPPLSPTLMFPQSPPAFLLSPRWREM